MTRNGKIARLPRELREVLNRRLADGEMGWRLIEWLNSLPATRAVLAADFGGRPVNEQNLSEWKQGGFAEWQRHQEDREYARTLAENAQELAGESERVPAAELLAAPAALALGRLLHEAAALEGSEKRAATLGVVDRLAQLRRENQRAERTRLEKERWEEHQENAREKKREAVERAAREKRFREHFFPHQDEDGLPCAGGLPDELRACLAASKRLQAAQTSTADQAESK